MALKRNKILKHLLLSLFLTVSVSFFAQSTWTFPVSGRVTKSGKKLEGSTVTLFKNGTQVNQTVTGNNGKFNFVLDPDAEYIVTVTRQGFITKRFSFSTKNVPADRAKQGFGGVDLQEIEIFEYPKGVDVNELNAILADPIAKFGFQSKENDFYYDEKYTQSIHGKLEKLAEAQKKAEEQEKKKSDSDKGTNDKFDAAMAKADKAMASGDLTTAKNAYNEAAGYKPDDINVKGKLKNVDDLIAKAASDKAAAAKEKELNDKYNAAISKGDQALAAKDYSSAKTAYTDATGLKPAEKYPKDKLAEIDKALADAALKAAKDKELNDKYNAAIAKGDQTLGTKDYPAAKAAYNEALGLKPAEKYPKDKLAEIDKAIADAAAKDAADKAKAAKDKELNDKYVVAIGNADKNMTAKDYASAKALYTEASGYKPAEKYPKDKLAEIDKILADIAAKDAAAKDKAAKDKELNDKYTAAIAMADKAFTAKDYAGAKTSYTDALGFKPSEKYPKDKIAEIDKIAADAAAKDAAEKAKAAKEKELNDKYNAAIAKADQALGINDYKGARATYTEALTLKPAEKYPKDKIAEIDKVLGDAAAKEAGEKARAAKEKEMADKYAAAVAKGDKSMTAKDYVTAKASYTDALSFKPAESYPKDKLAEIDKILGDNAAKLATEKGKAAKEAKEKEINDKYSAAIAKGDKAFTAKDYLTAKAAFNEATTLKLAEQYPKDKLLEIEKILADEASKDASDKEKAAKEKELNEKYSAAVARGNKALTAKDWDNAKTAYNEALTVKPNEQLPKDKLVEIERLMAADSADKDKTAKQKELNDKYTATIAIADKAFVAKDYVAAKANYNEALGFKPAEKYPKDKLAEIEKILADLEAKAAAEKDKNAKEQDVNEKYVAVIGKADKAFVAKQYPSAQALYSEALGVKPDEKYPKDKIKEIEQLLDAVEAKSADTEKQEKYKVLIAKADKQMAIKEYIAAKMIYKDALVVKPDEKYPKDKIVLIDGLLAKQKAAAATTANTTGATAKTGTASVTKTAAIIAPPADNDPEKKKQYVNALVGKYKQGMTEEQAQEGNCKVIKRIVVSGNNAAIYRKSVWGWGGVFYFKDDVPITEATFNAEAQ